MPCSPRTRALAYRLATGHVIGPGVWPCRLVGIGICLGAKSLAVKVASRSGSTSGEVASRLHPGALWCSRSYGTLCPAATDRPDRPLESLGPIDQPRPFT